MHWVTSTKSKQYQIYHFNLHKQTNKQIFDKKKSMFMSVQTCANHGNRTITEIEQGVTGSMSDAQAPTGQKQ